MFTLNYFNSVQRPALFSSQRKAAASIDMTNNTLCSSSGSSLGYCGFHALPVTVFEAMRDTFF